MGKKTTKPRPNYFMAIFSMALLLFIILIVGTAWLHSRAFVKQMKENINLAIELDVGTTESDVAVIKQFLHKMPETISATYKFVPKEDAFDAMAQEFGDDFLTEEFPNPLLDVITINIKEEYMNEADVNRIKQEIEGVSDQILGVYFEDSILQGSLQNVEKAGLIVVAACMIMFIVVLTLIHNTVKLSLFANRFIIKNMELVGARPSFIIMPFIQKSVLQGVLACLLALVFLAILGFYVYQDFPEILTVTDWKMMMLLILTTAALGILISTISTTFIVRKYLRLRMNSVF